ncbi:aminotransferase-like domain-containing protein [Sphingobacterium composti Ten et al. 2007 non Yoo et al. 2007]|uniref:aminotransferase-like domain-containing protein n=1 Tax=Sphingobacterium composti TaxID=363260 RepID=UPI001358FD5C|nr:PLP-dependent aminotransferase family protein [Sphingobacterium composti Ten et al. 2007 non Yoo et al. 2007]
MNSPVLQNILTYIRINKIDSSPVYLQIANGIINAIQTKSIKTGEKLPGTRILSEKLYVHRQTIVAAYEELSAQGWVDILPQKGAFISSKKIKPKAKEIPQSVIVSTKTAYPIEINYVLDSPFQPITNDLYFTDGTPDFRLTNFKSLHQIFGATSNKKSARRQLNKHIHTQNTNIKNQLQNYLYITKGLAFHANQILTFQSNQLAFQCIIQTILKPKDKVIVTQVGHFEVNMKLKERNVELITVNTNSEGIDTGHLEDLLQKHTIRAIYLQTNNLYPITSALSETNKSTLLELAQKHGFAIIENDNNTDFVYGKIPIKTLKSMDTQGAVIYVNSFKDLLPNPYDLAFVIAPDNLILELSKVKKLGQSPSTYLIEETIAEYIKEGLLLRQTQKLTKIYQKRRDNFSLLLDQYLEQSIWFEKPEIGLAYWIKFNQQLPLLSIATYCATKNLTVPNYLFYQNQSLTGIRLGFAHLTESEAEEAIALLSKAIYQHIYK